MLLALTSHKEHASCAAQDWSEWQEILAGEKGGRWNHKHSRSFVMGPGARRACAPPGDMLVTEQGQEGRLFGECVLLDSQRHVNIRDPSTQAQGLVL